MKKQLIYLLINSLLYGFTFPLHSQTPVLTWISGSDIANQQTILKTFPGVHNGSISWVETSGDIWLFGGNGLDKNGSGGYLNDLWHFDPTSGEWTWMAGSDVTNQSGTYGTQSIGSTLNMPGSRSNSISYIDASGKLWLFGGWGYDKNGTGGRLNDLWRYDPANGEWTWMAGSDVVNQSGTYGTQGTGSIVNIPGARLSSVAWTDSSGDFWLFGGDGYDKNGASSWLNDLWRYTPTTGKWTWMGGSDIASQVGTYGIQGTGSTTNIPGSRSGSVSWTDTSGSFWLFGGYGKIGISFGKLNDLWRYNPGTGEWTWMAGSDVLNQGGNYGTLGVGGTANIPASRSLSVSWTDGSGNFWLFGGYGKDKNSTSGRFNDLWSYNPTTGEWTWMTGSDIVNQSGSYGTLGTGNATNNPGARENAVSWTDNSGKLWLFAGGNYDLYGLSGGFNDLWRYDPVNKEWAWMAGSDVTNRSGDYGTQGISNPVNILGARTGSISWTDASGKSWLYGGGGYDKSGTYSSLNEFWYNPAPGVWMWIAGSDVGNQAAVYGTQGISSPANNPGSRGNATSWTDNSGNLWLFGGGSYMNDLWRFDVVTREWTWIAGSNVGSQAGVYGILGIGSTNNIPGGRQSSISWTDASGKFWLLGGFGYDSNGSTLGYLNDLWRFDPVTQEWTWIAGSNIADQSGIYGTQGTGSTANIPGARSQSISWTDLTGNFWLFGGNGFDKNGVRGRLNDLWHYNPSTGEWTWMTGSDVRDFTGDYGLLGISSSTNRPKARTNAVSWTDASGKFWMFGGYGVGDLPYEGYYNDLWRYDPTTGEWTWMAGSKLIDQTGTYGIQGTGNTNNIPVGREYASAWTDALGSFWLLGGSGYDKVGTLGTLNDLWKIEFIPGALDTLIAHSYTQNQVVIKWAIDPYADNYTVDVSIDNFSTLNQQLIVTDTFAVISSLDAGVQYAFRITSSNNLGASPFSNTLLVLTKPVTPVLNAVDTADIAQTMVAISWQAVTGIADDYQVEVSLTDFTSPTLLTGYPLTVTGSSLNIGSDMGTAPLAPGTNYWLRVRSRNSSGESTNSNVEVILTKPATPVLDVIEPAINTQTSVNISWLGVSGVVDDYQIEVSSTDFATPTILPGYPLTVTGTTLNIGVDAGTTALTPGTNYWFRVRSRNASGESPNSNVQTTLTRPATPVLNAVAIADIDQTSALISWQAITGVVDNYVIDVSDDGFQTFLTGFNGLSIAATLTSNSVTGLNPGTAYTARLRSENSSGQSPNSATVSFLTIPADPVATAAASITTSTFQATWNAVTGADYYILEVSDDDFTTTILRDSITGQLFSDVTGLSEATAYTYRLQAGNATGVSGFSNIVPVTTDVNTTPLAINASFTPTFDTELASANITITVNGGLGNYTVTLKYKGLLANAWSADQVLSPETSGDYLFTILPTMLDNLGVQFDVTVTDGTNSDSEAGTITKSFTAAKSPAIPFELFGGTDQSWNLFSIPYVLDNKSIGSIFADYDPTRHEFDWRIVRYRNSSNDYINSGQVQLGEAYWFNAKEDLGVKVGAGQVTSQLPFTKSLAKGWNLIGNPYPVNISWEQVILDNPTVTGVESLQVFKGISQSTGDIMTPFGGGFVWSDQAASMVIDPRTANTGGRISSGKRKIASDDIDMGEWLLDINLVTDDRAGKLGGFGMHPEAAVLKDRYDAMSVPRFMVYTDLFTEHSDYFYPWFATDVVPTTTSYTWVFTLATNEFTGTNKITWDQAALEGKVSGLYLLDKTSGKLIDMKQQGSHIVDLRSGEFKFEIYFTGLDQPVLPQDLILGTAYPNPANTHTRIPVLLPAGLGEKRVNLSIYDINGKHITTLAEGSYAPGIHEFTWDIKGATGQNVSGMFIYRLLISDSSIPPMQKKLIVR
jgi:N-acetylneuraminic acid mutarotase